MAVAAVAALVMLSMVPMAAAVAWPGDEPGTAGAGPRAGDEAPRGIVVLPSGRQLDVEIADTPTRIRRGYMFREKISDNEGMVFLLGRSGFHSFWMKNCKVALDIVWLDEKWSVVHVEENLPPCAADPCPSWSPLRAATYVLEVRAGLAAPEGLAVGATVVFVPPDPPERAPGAETDNRH